MRLSTVGLHLSIVFSTVLKESTPILTILLSLEAKANNGKVAMLIRRLKKSFNFGPIRNDRILAIYILLVIDGCLQHAVGIIIVLTTFPP